MISLLTLMQTTVRATAVVLALTATLVQAGETTNSVGISMVDIPAGSFMMGSCKVSSSANCGNTDSDAGDDETPQHPVSVGKFQMGKTEVTLGQFKKYIAATGNNGILNDNFIKSNAYGDNAPVVQVSWLDAQAFIDWLNKIAGGGYRLPSEAEWEYACRAGGNDTYCGSNNVSDVAWYDGNSNNSLHAVGGKQANAFGLYDMSGNVWEWVEDCWHSDYSDAPANGSVWYCDNNLKVRGLRGGSWYFSASSSRAAGRYYYSRGYPLSIFGFRLARTR